MKRRGSTRSLTGGIQTGAATMEMDMVVTWETTNTTTSRYEYNTLGHINHRTLHLNTQTLDQSCSLLLYS